MRNVMICEENNVSMQKPFVLKTDLIFFVWNMYVVFDM